MPGPTTPIVGRTAVIQYSAGTAVTIGYATGVTADIAVDLIKEFALGSDKASILAAGNKSFKVAVDKMYIDNTYATLVYAGAPVDFIFAPAGTATGYPKVTIKNVVLIAHNLKVDQKGVVAEKVSGEGNDYVIASF